VLICGLVFLEEIKMFCNKLGIKLLSFSLAFGLGFFIVNLFISKQLPKQTNMQKAVSEKPSFSSSKSLDCRAINPNDEKRRQEKLQEKNYEVLNLQKTAIEIWLEKNQKADEKEKTKKRERLAELEKEIEDAYWEHERFILNKDNQNLLYRENCN
jgi:hypothetical protein